MIKKGNPVCGVMMYLIVALVVFSMSFVLLKAVHHPEPTQPRAPMHDSK
jgi:hypothetical protein